MKIRDMSISARAKSCLLRAGYIDSSELKELTEEQLLSVKNLNQNCVDEIRHALSSSEEKDTVIDNKVEIEESNISLAGDYDSEDLESFKKILFEVLGTLTEREQKILILRFGLEDGKHRTLEEVSSYFDLTRERIRQIQVKALRKLRHPARSRLIRPYVDSSLDIADILKKYADKTLVVRKPVVEANDVLHNEASIESVNRDIDKEIEEIEKPELDSDIKGDKNLLKKSIDELELSVRSYNCLKRSGIDIVRDLCIKTTWDLMHIRNLGRKAGEEVYAKMKEIGVSEYKGDELPFMYGYPDRIKDIAIEKSRFWRTRLYIEIIINNYEWLEEFRKTDVVLWNKSYFLKNVSDFSELQEFLSEKLKSFKALCQELADVAENPNEIYDEKRIVNNAETFMRIYRKFVKWRESFGLVNAIPDYHEVIEALFDSGSKVIKCYDDFYEKLIIGRKKLNLIIENDEENFDIDLGFCFNAELEDFKIALDRVMVATDSENIDTDNNFTDPTQITIDELELGIRSYYCLKRAGIVSLGDICELTLEDLLKVRNLGRKGAEEVLRKVKEHGLSLQESKEENEDLITQGDDIDLGIKGFKEFYNILKDEQKRSD